MGHETNYSSFFFSDLGKEDSSTPVMKDENTPIPQDTRGLSEKSLQKSAKVFSHMFSLLVTWDTHQNYKSLVNQKVNRNHKLGEMDRISVT
jgi:hypothetical protein